MVLFDVVRLNLIMKGHPDTYRDGVAGARDTRDIGFPIAHHACERASGCAKSVWWEKASPTHYKCFQFVAVVNKPAAHRSGGRGQALLSIAALP